MQEINSALRSHRKPPKPQNDQLIHFNQVISSSINRLIVNIPTNLTLPISDQETIPFQSRNCEL